jgi:AbrB family looped-hinge helix DNA binding protein
MKVSLDRAGRVVVPKPLRDALGIAPGMPLEIDVVDGHLELAPPDAPATIVQGPGGPVVAATGTRITADDVRRALEAARERR